MKRLLFSVLALAAFVTAFAAVRPADAAAALAAETLSRNAAGAPARAVSATDLRLTATVPMLHDEDTPALYVFNRPAGGAAIISGDDRTLSVVAYTEEGSFDLENANPAFRFWIRRAVEQISAVAADRAADEADAPALAPEAVQYTAISPLLGNIAFDQETPYWNRCPMDLWYTSERCLTGCVATGTAQIMKFWQWPLTATGGTYSYTWTCYDKRDRTRTQTLALNYDTVAFDWSLILPTYSGSYTAAQADEVAWLMYAVGVGCDMQYGGNTIGGSGSWTDQAGRALMENFRYRPLGMATEYTEADYGSAYIDSVMWEQTTSQIRTYIFADLEAGRPVLMGGEDTDGGHEFVCDGRDASGYLHINWGWEGSCNCYTPITTLKPTGTSYQFKYNIDCLFGVEPDRGTTPTSVVTNDPAPAATKHFRNGTLVIRRGPREYSVLGQ